MGSTTSKGSRAAGSAARQYPSRASTQTTAPAQHTAPRSQPRPTVHPSPQASETLNEAINLDASDPQYATNLRQLGVVDSNPFHSHSSTQPSGTQVIDFAPPGSNARPPTYDNSSPFPFPSAASMNAASNPALRILQARSQLQDKADKEFENVGRKTFQGREFLDVALVSQILLARGKGVPDQEIEKHMGLRKGIVGRLGKRGVVEAIALEQ